jgi:hypothetical protein
MKVDSSAEVRRFDWSLQRRRLVAVLVVAGILSVLAVVLDDGSPSPGVAGLPYLMAQQAPDSERTLDVYDGYGTWVDIYDFVPAVAGPTPAVTPDTVDDMARQGVRTLYLQAGQLDPELPGLLADPGLVAQILVRAHMADMRVVGWYLPRFGDIDRDLQHLEAIAEFEVLGHRFDGVAVDIEWTQGVPDHAARSDALVELSERLRESVGDDQTLGAIVLPPVQTEVINPRKWPEFPWRELADLYDVWLPMGYWTVRAPESGYHDGLTYTEESVRRLRDNLGDDDAPVHVIGGIGDGLDSTQASRFVQAIAETDAIGASIYDWATLNPTFHSELAAAFPDD